MATQITLWRSDKGQLYNTEQEARAAESYDAVIGWIRDKAFVNGVADAGDILEAFERDPQGLVLLTTYLAMKASK